MTKKDLYWLLALIILIILSICITRKQSHPYPTQTTINKRDTIVIRDTVRISDTKTVLKNTHTIRYDTIILHDTIIIDLPIESREYQSDDFYALIEGYNPQLKYIEVYPKTQIITEKIALPAKRLSHGLNLGTGIIYGTKGLDLGFYIGYGFTLKF